MGVTVFLYAGGGADQPQNDSRRMSGVPNSEFGKVLESASAVQRAGLANEVLKHVRHGNLESARRLIGSATDRGSCEGDSSSAKSLAQILGEVLENHDYSKPWIEMGAGSVEIKGHNFPDHVGADVTNRWFSEEGELICDCYTVNQYANLGKCAGCGSDEQIAEGEDSNCSLLPVLSWSGNSTLTAGFDVPTHMPPPCVDHVCVAVWPVSDSFDEPHSTCARFTKALHSGLNRLYVELKGASELWRFLYLYDKSTVCIPRLLSDKHLAESQSLQTQVIAEVLTKLGFESNGEDEYSLGTAFVAFAWSRDFFQFAYPEVTKALRKQFPSVIRDPCTRIVSVAKEKLRQSVKRVFKDGYVSDSLLDTMTERMNGSDHLPSTPEGIICLDLIAPIVRSLVGCESLTEPIMELQGMLQEDILQGLRYIEEHSEIYYNHGGGPAYWASVVMQHALISAVLPDWCEGTVGSVSSISRESSVSFKVAHWSADGLQPSKNDKADGLRQFAADNFNRNGYRVFYHGTSASRAEAVVNYPKESRGTDGYHLDLGDRFYTSEDIAVAAEWACQKFAPVSSEVPVVVGFAVPDSSLEPLDGVAYREDEDWKDIVHTFLCCSRKQQKRYRGHAYITCPMSRGRRTAGVHLRDFRREAQPRRICNNTQVAFQTAFNADGVDVLTEDAYRAVFVLHR
eukprot:gb/GECG01013692.1/.p1 GENE.gb/GECG01013692.1/~~gb/GECG01013692.1/.p1  ORF type:complete len:682 (+),score=65.61 gb/GECG01013692.1/:1-2046(+)